MILTKEYRVTFANNNNNNDGDGDGDDGRRSSNAVRRACGILSPSEYPVPYQ